MSTLHVDLFGKLHVQRDQQIVVGLDAHKVQELFCYLLLYRDRPHPRETLAELIWDDIPPTQSKKYLRQAIWQVQHVFESHTETLGCRVLTVEPDWVQFNPAVELCLDVLEFEQAFDSVRGVSGRQLKNCRALTLQKAIKLYQGDLLEGWYQDWCLYERERLQNMYLAMLQKLMAYDEAHGQYETGQDYGVRILHYDPARERVHRRLMRLYYLAGDRTSALRQYTRCVDMLAEELQVQPARQTVALYQQIKADHLETPPPIELEPPSACPGQAPPLSVLLEDLKQIQASLGAIQRQVAHEIELIESTVDKQS